MSDHPLDPATADLIRRMPKAEIHLHLDGSLRPETALELARQGGLDEGLDLTAMQDRLQAPERCADQAELLQAFALPIRLMQEASVLERVAGELVEDVATDGTVYAEIRWAPALHLDHGLPLDEGIGAVVRGTAAGAAATGVVVRLIAVALRSHPPLMSERVAQAASRYLDQGLTGFDLAGDEAGHPDVLDHVRAFDLARQAGLAITVHAGEWGGAGQVARALAVSPSRIAHGAPAMNDDNLVDRLIDGGVTLDLCPTSNVQAGMVPDVAAHPLRRLFQRGVPVTLSTDDRTVSDMTLVREYERAVTQLGVTPAELWAMDRHALRVAFLHHEESLRARLLDAFDRFAAGEPALAGGT